MTALKPKAKKRKTWCKVHLQDGRVWLDPAHQSDADDLIARGLRDGDVVTVTLNKRRNPRFYRLAHALGRLVAEQCAGFETEEAARDWHGTLKRLQRESGLYCETMELHIDGIGKVPARFPVSLSFESMDETEFRSFFDGMVQHIRGAYWPTLTDRQVMEQVELISGERL